jgi:diguanylate cyclase (GGDEF)-like protein
MIEALRTFLKRNKVELGEIKLYFEKCADDIDRTNIYMLRKTCMWTSIVYVCMLFLAMLIIPRFKFTIGHMLLIPLLVVYFVINIHTRKQAKLKSATVNALCLMFFFCLCICFILMEINEETVHPSRWLPLMMMVYPALYIERHYKYGVQESIMLVIYCIMTFPFKDPPAFFRDVYTFLAAYVLSMIIAREILGVRSKEGLAMAELKRFSTMDKLTNVLNKGAFLAEVESYLKHREEDTSCAMCVIDVDDFKNVNDNLGHNTGDELLEHIGELLIENFRPSDIIGRYGGDEFVVFMPNMREPALVEFRCKAVQMMLHDFSIGNSEPFSLSIGVVVDRGVHSQEELFRMADDALYKSKIAGKNRCSAWITGKDENLSAPGMVFLSVFDEKKAENLIREESENFEILIARTDDEAIGFLSQYHKDIRIVVVEVANEEKDGALVVKYMKQRGSFGTIPILAVTRSQAGTMLAKELGADAILTTDTPEEEFKSTIKELISREEKINA